MDQSCTNAIRPRSAKVEMQHIIRTPAPLGVVAGGKSAVAMKRERLQNQIEERRHSHEECGSRDLRIRDRNKRQGWRRYLHNREILNFRAHLAGNRAFDLNADEVPGLHRRGELRLPARAGVDNGDGW